MSSKETFCPTNYDQPPASTPIEALQLAQPDYFGEYTTANLGKIITHCQQIEAPTVIITDLDDTITDTIKQFYRQLDRYYHHLQKVLSRPLEDEFPGIKWQDLSTKIMALFDPRMGQKPPETTVNDKIDKTN